MIEVTHYGVLREVFGGRTQEVASGEAGTVKELLDGLAEATPAFRALRPSTAVAVEDRLVSEDHPLPAGARVALLPPVSGG